MMSDNLFRFADEFGPLKIIHVYEPSVDLRAVLVVDNVALGPSIGGVRMAPDVSTEECFRLARAMTLKNAAAGIPHGGGKVVVYGDPKMPKENKERILRTLASALRNEESYIFAPDMGTDEHCMGWVRDEIGRVCGLPRELGGIPLDEIGATAWGVTQVCEVAAGHCGFQLEGSRFSVQGFGAVGKHSARFLAKKGAVLVAASDTGGTIENLDGLDVEELLRLKEQHKSVVDYPHGKPRDRDAIIDVECDIWIPAARPDVIHEQNVDRLHTRLVVQGANIPVTTAAEATLAKKGILNIPDFIANAGGVICAAMEYHGANESAVLDAIAEKIRRNTETLLARIKRDQIEARQAAIEMALERVKKVMGLRRFSTFSMAPRFL
ncbi:MAG: Glu/Leu/Phe/Val family dehydrogenase [Gammaproteobacteria bacterium]